jgi:hypothetical protein
VEHASAVIETDSARAAATADFLAGRAPLERVLAAIEVQSAETTAFLRGLTEYNRAIAQYAVAGIPENADPEKVVAALMVE